MMAYDRSMSQRPLSRHPRTGSLLPVLGVLLLASPGITLAQRFEPGPPAKSVREPPRTAATKGADRIVREIERKYDARVVRQEMSEVEGRKVLVLRLLSEDGRVWRVRVDAESGKEL